MSDQLSPSENKLTEDNLNKMIPTNGFKDEKHFQREFTKYLKASGYFVKKMSDSDRSHKPCDCFIIGPDQITFWFELKYIDKYIFNTDHLRPNQVDFLRNVVP